MVPQKTKAAEAQTLTKISEHLLGIAKRYTGTYQTLPGGSGSIVFIAPWCCGPLTRRARSRMGVAGLAKQGEKLFQF